MNGLGGHVRTFGTAGIAKVSSHSDDGREPARLSRAAAPDRARFGQRFAHLRDDIETRCEKFDLAPDLAEDIGSSRWFRGLATMVGLGVVAVSFWPDLTQVEAATAMPVEQEERDEYRSQMIMPLALGGDSGRHMGATPLVTPLKSAPERPRIELVSTLGQGDSLGRMLQRSGLGAADAKEVLELVAKAVPPASIEPGTQFDIVLGKRTSQQNPRPLERIGFRARFDLDLAVTRSASGGLALERSPIRVDETPLRIRGTVGNSLYRSARAAGAPTNAIRDYLRAIDRHLSLERDVRADDEFDLILAYKRSAKGDRQAGDLLYAGIERSGKPKLQLLRWGKQGEFFEASGVGRSRSSYVQPVPGGMSSGYGMRRHPILGFRRMHGGVDFRAGYGTPIRAVSDGIVARAGRNGGYGNFVRLDHANGLGTGYAHMSRIAVSRGARVRAGQVIGYVGSTGLSTGPHLHFEVYRGSRKINPTSVTFMSRPQIDGAELARFKSRLASLKAIPAGAALVDIAPTPAEQAAPVREIDRLGALRVPALPDASEARQLASGQEGRSVRN